MTTLDQLLQNHTAISKDGKLYGEWHVKQAYELGQTTLSQRIAELEGALREIKNTCKYASTAQKRTIQDTIIKVEKIATNALNPTKP